jgi:hypothetical protein
MKLDDAAFRRITVHFFFISCNTNKAAHPKYPSRPISICIAGAGIVHYLSSKEEIAELTGGKRAICAGFT